jgi:hypothetical protein
MLKENKTTNIIEKFLKSYSRFGKFSLPHQNDWTQIWQWFEEGEGEIVQKKEKRKKEKKKSLWCVFVTTDNVLTKQACKKRFFFSWEKSEEKTNLIGVGNWWLYLWAFFQLQKKHILPKDIAGRQKILKVYLFESKHFLLNIFNSFFNIQMGYFGKRSLDRISLDRNCVLSLDQNYVNHLIEFFDTFHLIEICNNDFDQTPKN